MKKVQFLLHFFVFLHKNIKILILYCQKIKFKYFDNLYNILALFLLFSYNLSMENKNINKRKYYTKYDAGTTFFWAILAPQLVALVFVFILSCISSISNIEYNTLLQNNFVNILSLLIAPIAFFLVFYFVNKKNNIDIKSATSFSFKVDYINVLVCITISIFCVFGFMLFVNMFDELISLTGFIGNYSLPLPLDNFGWLLLNLLLLALLPAIFEEFVFRGMIYNGLCRYGKYAAIFGSALLFALMHGGIEQTVYPFIVGIIMSLVMYKTNNVLYTMIIHFCNNAIVIIYNYIMTKLSVIGATGFNFVAKDILLAIFMAIASMLIIICLIKFLMSGSKRKFSLDELEYSNPPKFVQKSNFLLMLGIAIGVFFWLTDLFTGFGA